MSDSEREQVLSLEDEESENFDGFTQKDVMCATKKAEKKKPAKKPTMKTRSKKKGKQEHFAKKLDNLSFSDIENLKVKLGIKDSEPTHEHRHAILAEEGLSDNEFPLSQDANPDYNPPLDWMEEEEWEAPKLKAPERGQEIRDSLANMIQTAFTAQCATDDIIDKYKVPKNCERIEPPLVNSEVWGEVNKKAHSEDRGIKVVQNLIATGVLPLIKLAEDPRVNASQDIRGCIRDSLTLLGQAQYNLSVKRRYLLRPHLKKQYGKLCSASTPITTFLFGDDLSREMKRCESSVRIGRDPNWTPHTRGRGFRGRRFHPYPTQRRVYNPTTGFQHRGAFMYRGRGRGRPAATAPNPNAETGN